MTDPQIPAAPVVEPAAPAEPAAPEAPVDYTAHPVWGKAVEAVPDVLRGPLYEAIKTSEREAQKAIESARGTDIPQDWRELAAEAQQAGLSVDDLAAAYRGQAALAELMRTDPDAFVSELSGQIDQLVASGQLTRREGAQAKQQAQQAADAAGAGGGEQLYQSDVERELAELKQWREQQQAAEQQRQLEAQQAQQAEQIRQQEEAESNAYFDAFDREMEAAGIMQRNATTGALEAAIPVQTLQLIARTGAQLRDANPQLPHAEAIKQAHQQVKAMIESTGGTLGPARAATPPVIGASSSIPTNQVAQPAGQPRSMADRQAAALAEALRLANG